MIENVIGNDALMIRLFIGTLKGIAFDWFLTLPLGSINSWTDLEARFLSHFYEDNIEGSMPTLIKEKQRKGKEVKDFVKRFRNLSLRCLKECLYPCYYKHAGIIYVPRLNPT